MAAPPLSPLAAEVRRHDRDRFVTALFAPAAQRESLLALYTFNLEIARTRESVSEILLGEIRLQWWRDAIEKLYSGTTLAHPVVEGLGAALKSHNLSRALFDRLIDARTADLDDGPLASLDAMEDYADGTAAALVALALEVLGAAGDDGAHTARHIGVGWGLVGLLRAVPFHARARRLYLPADLLAEHGVAHEQIFAVRNTPGLAVVAEIVARRAYHHFSVAQAAPPTIPRQARSPLLIATLGKVYLSRLRAARFNLTDPLWSTAIRPPMLRLAFRSLTTGY